MGSRKLTLNEYFETLHAMKFHTFTKQLQEMDHELGTHRNLDRQERHGNLGSESGGRVGSSLCGDGSRSMVLGKKECPKEKA